MSNSRRLPRPKRYRVIAIAAAVIVAAGGGALAVAATSGSGGSGAAAGSGQSTAADLAVAQDGTVQPTSPGAGDQPQDTASATVTPSGSPSGTLTPTPSSTVKIVQPTATVRGVTIPTAPRSTGRSSGTYSTIVAHFTGVAFDTCTAPSASKMASWHGTSPYGGAAVYIGGANRGCAQPQLTASWVKTVSAAGWKLIPLYVGAQPPCQTSGNPERITATNAASLGTSDGADAVAKASALGMKAGSPVFLDMEGYDTTNTSCVKSVLTYIQAWDRALDAKGYVAGFYGFVSSSATAVAQAKPTTPDMPDAIWYAKYDGTNSTTTGFPFASDLWTGHRRGHQYKVNSKETYGGVTLTVDRDAWDGPVAVV